jgi:hypothetical protein
VSSAHLSPGFILHKFESGGILKGEEMITGKDVFIHLTPKDSKGETSCLLVVTGGRPLPVDRRYWRWTLRHSKADKRMPKGVLV